MKWILSSLIIWIMIPSRHVRWAWRAVSTPCSNICPAHFNVTCLVLLYKCFRFNKPSEKHCAVWSLTCGGNVVYWCNIIQSEIIMTMALFDVTKEYIKRSMDGWMDGWMSQLGRVDVFWVGVLKWGSCNFYGDLTTYTSDGIKLGNHSPIHTHSHPGLIPLWVTFGSLSPALLPACFLSPFMMMIYELQVTAEKWPDSHFPL